MGAGILPVAEHNGKLYFLFGKEYNGKKWSDFGGARDKNETHFDNAIREGYEETDGILGTEKELKKLVNKDRIVKLDVRNEYYSYLFKIPYNVKLPEYFNNHHKFISKHFPSKINKDGFFEKTEIKWVTMNELKNNHIKFRPFYNNIINIIITHEATILDITRKIK